MKFHLTMAGLWMVTAAAASDTMPVAQQNAMVGKYCAVCHKDAFRNGGLSLEHFDAADADPGLAAMMVSKLKNGALGASGQKTPDKATEAAFESALTAASAGADRWIVKRVDSTATVASIVQEAPMSAVNGVAELYRLTISCDARTREGAVQVAWSPRVPAAGAEVSAAVDGAAAATYRVEGGEKMGNGQAGTSGPAAVPLVGIGLPARTLTVSGVFADQTVVFPFDAVTRQELSGCFPGRH